MSEHVFKPGDTAVITTNDARSATDLEHTRLPLAEGDRVEVVCGPDADGDYLVRPGDWYIAARFLAPADEPAPDVDGCVAERGRITRIIRRHANSDALPRNVRNALSSIVDEIEMMTEPAPDPQPSPRCTYGADCQVHPDENRLHNYDDAAPIGPMPAELAARVLELAQRVAKLEARLQGVIETHHLWDGS